MDKELNIYCGGFNLSTYILVKEVESKERLEYYIFKTRKMNGGVDGT